MAADFVLGGITVAPGRQTWWFTFSWQPGDHPNRGPVLCQASPDHPAGAVDVKLVIEDYAQARSAQGPVYYYGLISNLGTQSVTARLFARSSTTTLPQSFLAGFFSMNPMCWRFPTGIDSRSEET